MGDFFPKSSRMAISMAMSETDKFMDEFDPVNSNREKRKKIRAQQAGTTGNTTGQESEMYVRRQRGPAARRSRFVRLFAFVLSGLLLPVPEMQVSQMRSRLQNTPAIGFRIDRSGRDSVDSKK